MQHAVLDAARQVWPPFVLVAGLLAIGTVVEADGLFAAVGTRIELIGGSTFRLFAALLALEAVVAALLNLDTAVVFLTPILLHAARQRGCDERPFLYGALFIANAASILLPGSNLTNLIVLAHEHLSGAEVAKAMALPWVASVALTIVLLALWYRPHAEEGARVPLPPLRLRTGALATIIASGFILAFENPALPVLVVSIVAVTVRRLRPPRQQPSRRVAPGSAAATSSTPAPARPEPRPEPCRQRFIGGIPLVPLGPRFRCPPLRLRRCHSSG